MVKISNKMISMVKHQLPILATSNRCSYTKKLTNIKGEDYSRRR